ncbi:major outer membrane protein [Helicobacter burdigaliensis]|uniref:major outer membrane protein n=1 Tax=Helicobacter burdigaliensis TaxID=2315334 RepID=UPI000EF74216|nr:major outer membrane protein [Helicobacter burdigaliensis]
MKLLQKSLAYSVLASCFSTLAFSQPLEEAIKDIEVSGYLRYRYIDDRYDMLI